MTQTLPSGSPKADALVMAGAPVASRPGIRLGEGRFGRPLAQLLVIVAAVVVWQVIYLLKLVSTDALPSFPSVANAFVHLLVKSQFWSSVGATLWSALQGLFFAIIIGVPIGLLTGTYPIVERSTRLLLDFGRSFPIIALLPVMVLVLGSNTTMKATVVFLACVFPLLLQAQYGARSLEPTILETVQAYRIPRWLRYLRVTLPSATPSIMTGIRLAATTSVLVAIGVEILTTLPGIGQVIIQSQTDKNSPVSYAYIIAAGLIGYSVARLSEAAEQRLLRWRAPLEMS
jgi:ABC-type nitrate/sulfonate/bicarbonate transport system permease component